MVKASQKIRPSKKSKIRLKQIKQSSKNMLKSWIEQNKIT